MRVKSLGITIEERRRGGRKWRNTLKNVTKQTRV